jgi:hypothetical protein
MTISTMIIKRVPYAKADTPKELREYKLGGYINSPVGTLEEWKKFAKGHGCKKLAVQDNGFTEVDVE